MFSKKEAVFRSASSMAGTRGSVDSVFQLFPRPQHPAGVRTLLSTALKTSCIEASDASSNSVSYLRECWCKRRRSISTRRSFASFRCLSRRLLGRQSVVLSVSRPPLPGCDTAPDHVWQRQEPRTPLRCHGASSFHPRLSSSSSSAVLATGVSCRNSTPRAAVSLSTEPSTRVHPFVSSCRNTTVPRAPEARGYPSSCTSKSAALPSARLSSPSSPGLLPRFRSAAHRDMVVSVTRLHLQNLLLRRFGKKDGQKGRTPRC